MINLKARRCLYLTLIIVFIIISPLFIFYVFGYRYNFQLNKFQKTGAFYFRSNPAAAQIYLNDVNTKLATPNKITNLLPIEYQARIEKSGYWPWQKKLLINSSQTTFAEDIFLFKSDSQPELLINGEITNLLIAPNQEKFFYTLKTQTSNQNYIYYFSSAQSQLVNEVSYPLAVLSWSSDNNKILLKNSNGQYFILDTEKNNIINLEEIFNNQFNDLVWDNLNSNILWGLYQNHLYKVDLSNKNISQASTLKIFAIYPTAEGHYLIYQPADRDSLILGFAQYKKFDNLVEICELPNAKDYEINKVNDWLLINNPEEKILYFLNLLKNPVVYNILKPVKGYIIKNSNLLYWNDFEYWVFNLDNQTNELIERLSTPIKFVSWHPRANYLLVETENSLKIIETDDRDQKNYYPLLKPELPILNSLFFEPQFKSIIFHSSINKQSGIYLLNLQ